MLLSPILSASLSASQLSLLTYVSKNYKNTVNNINITNMLNCHNQNITLCVRIQEPTSNTLLFPIIITVWFLLASLEAGFLHNANEARVKFVAVLCKFIEKENKKKPHKVMPSTWPHDKETEVWHSTYLLSVLVLLSSYFLQL